jgi:hypothetical protein
MANLCTSGCASQSLKMASLPVSWDRQHLGTDILPKSSSDTCCLKKAGLPTPSCKRRQCVPLKH